MSIHGYIGNVITANPTAPTSSVATGVWTTEQQLIAMAAGNWPMAFTQISRSLRFNSADSAYLNRTPSSASNRKTWTWSGWVKRNIVNTTGQNLFSTDNGSSTTIGQLFFNDDWLEFNCYASSAYQWRLITTQVWRDLSAWYHIVAVVDTTQATSSNRVKLYVKGVQITAFTTATYPSLNFDGAYNLNQPHYIGAAITSSGYLNGYLTEVNFIDGQALTPSSFGFNSSDTGVWSPKQYTGPFGTNGFYVNFSDNSNTTAATLGKDYSGNGNNWTPNNFSVTAGAGNDSMVDSPTAYGTDTGVGGEVRGNYSTLNPLFVNNTYPITYSNGNLNATRAGGGQGGITNTFGMSSGKWYWEVVFSTFTYNIGITTNPAGSTTGSEGLAGYNGGGGTSIGLQPNGVLRTNGTAGSTYTSWTTGDVMGIALDMDGGNLYFYKNGTVMNSGSPVATSLTGSTWFFITSAESGASLVANFGQRAFAYTAPSGFKALCTTNLPTPTIGATSTTLAGKYFNPVLYTGNGSSQSITGVGFQPDFTWIKSRSGADNHNLFNAVVGLPNRLFSNLTNAENTTAGTLTSFNSDGFSVGSISDVNANAVTFVGWNWNAGGSNATNTAGTITSTVRANTTSGFSIATYTGNGSGGATVGHGLGVSPAMIIIKSRSNSTNWMVWHQNLTANYAFEGLNTTGAETNGGSPSKYVRSVSSTLVTIGNDISVNQSASYTYVMYCFAPVAGYSAFGSYTGNGSANGPFVYTGFRPEFVMIKNASATGDWFIYDAVRNTYNVADNRLKPNLSDAEGTGGSFGPDILSNGFKMRSNFGEMNGSGNTIIYMAFAEFPFKFSLAR